MRFKIKFKCEKCGVVYYNHIISKSRKSATRYKKLFKNENSFIHDIFEGGCRKKQYIIQKYNN